MTKKATKKSQKASVENAEPKAKTPGQLAYEAYRKALDAPDASTVGRAANQYTTVKTPVLLEAFLTYLRKGHLPKIAAEAVGISRTTAFNWKREDPEFAKAWDEAIDEGTDLLEEAIIKRARDGVDRPVFQQGEMVGCTREYSDSLAALVLKGRRHQYKERQPEEDGKSGAVPSIIIHHGAGDANEVKVTVGKKKDKK